MVRESPTPSQGLTIYLLKQEHSTPQSILKNESGLDKHQIGPGDRPIGELYVKRTRPKAPRWTRFFETYIDPGQLGQISSVAAVLLVVASGKLFAITFGQGRYLLNSQCWEERFGLRVALNSIGEGKIRSIDKRTFDAISRHSREQASREATARDFGLDIEQDLLRAVTGTPIDPTLGRRIYGMDALHVSVNTRIELLHDLLCRYYEKYLDKSYRQFFPWVDQIAEITNPSLIEELDRLLLERIVSGQFERIWMAVPEVVPWERISGFRFGLGHRSPEHNDIHLPKFLDSLREVNAISKKTLTQRRVYCIDNDGITYETWQAYRCIYCEIDLNDNSYLLSGGKWYRIDRGFVNEVNHAYSRIPRFEHDLPEYNDASETNYNQRVVESDPAKLALMDRKSISYGGGYSKIEFCDIYTNNREIIHIKRYGSSSVLSHLFSQGLISGELFLTESQFRREVNSKLPRTHRIENIGRRPTSADYKIVFAIISDAPGDLILPFFSRLNLRHATRRLEGYGYQVALAKINVSEEFSKLSRYD